jgi:hypothetical protein
MCMFVRARVVGTHVSDQHTPLPVSRTHHVDVQFTQQPQYHGPAPMPDEPPVMRAVFPASIRAAMVGVGCPKVRRGSKGATAIVREVWMLKTRSITFRFWSGTPPYFDFIVFPRSLSNRNKQVCARTSVPGRVHLLACFAKACEGVRACPCDVSMQDCCCT